MTVITQLKEALDAGDPTVREWFLVDNYFLPPLLCIFYVFFVMKLGPQLMNHRKPFELRNTMVVYNFALVVVYLVCISSVFYHLLNSEIHKYICNKSEVVEGHVTYTMARIGHVIYLLKYVEFLDTIFFILRKKHHLVTGLHVVHHASLPFVGWIVMRTEFSGFQFFPGILNSFVHVIMYSYYGLAAIGPSMRKYLWWKKYLTILQMAQFVLIFCFVVIFIPLSGCHTSKFGTFVDIVFALLFLVLFYDYYKKTYKPNKESMHKDKISNGVHSNGVETSHVTKDENSNSTNELKEKSS